jgi:galactose-6-phosphate isomerase
MPLINISMALMSPNLADGFAVIRRQQVISNNGRATFNTTTISNLHGTVYPSSKNDLERFPNLQVMGKALTVITRFALRGESTVSGTDYAPDIVQWHGDNFVVVGLEDWSSYGPGFIFAVCQSMDLKDAPPTTE